MNPDDPTPAASAPPTAAGGSLDQLMQSITPNLGPFTDSLGPKIIMIVGLVWLLCIVAVVCLLLKGSVEFGASRAGGRPMSTADGVLDIGIPLAALIFLGIIPAAVQAAI